MGVVGEVIVDTEDIVIIQDAREVRSIGKDSDAGRD